jgi:hypothetical protein
MKILIINDTRIEKNPGCHATVGALIGFITENVRSSQIKTLPLGTLYDVFQPYQFFKLSFLKRVLRKVFNIHYQNFFNLKRWKHTVKTKIPKTIHMLIEDSDLVVINMEGTIHHNSVGAMSLMGLAYLSSLKKKKVAMVNGSYESMNDILTDFVFKRIDFLSVRELCSYDLLKTKYPVELIPDFAFKANLKAILYKPNLETNPVRPLRCLFTAGVLAVYPNMKNGIDFNTLKSRIAEIRTAGYEPCFLKVEDNEDFIEKELAQIQVQTISYDHGVVYENMGYLLETFDLLITGRYHIGIFGLMEGVKTFFLESNTYKIKGMLKFLNREDLLIYKEEPLQIKERLQTYGTVDLSKNAVFENYESFKLFLNRL